MADREQSGFGLQRALGADLQHVYGQDYGQRTEEVPDESPELGERLILVQLSYCMAISNSEGPPNPLGIVSCSVLEPQLSNISLLEGNRQRHENAPRALQGNPDTATIELT
jgi:hypothetical protein